MNKNQKNVLIVMLFLMALLILFPSTNMSKISGREFISELDHFVKIDFGQLIPQLVGIAMVGGALIVIFGKTKTQKRQQREKAITENETKKPLSED